MHRPALLFALSLALAAPALAQTAALTSGRDYQEDVYVTPYWTRAPVIEARGRAELEVAPNTARFSVTFIETDKDASEAMTRSVNRAKRAYEAIKRVGGPQSLAETSVEVEPYFEQYRDEEGDLVENDRADKIRGYTARTRIDVEVSGDTVLAGKVRAAALAAGPEESSSLDMSTRITAAVQRAAYKAAVADAADRAQESAEAAGASLGRLLVIQEGKGPCLGSWTRAEIGRELSADQLLNELPQVIPGERARASVTVTSQSLAKAHNPISNAEIELLELPSDRRPYTVASSVCIVYAAGN